MARVHQCIPVLSLMLLSLASVQQVYAAPIGTLASVDGTIFLHKGGGARYEKVDRAGAAVDSADMLRTASSSRATIKLTTGSQILLDKSSSVTFRDIDHVETTAGVALFDIKKQGHVAGFKVTTPVATIGIRGTQFAVEVASDSASSIYMNEGAIEVTSLGAQFKRYRKSTAAEFADYKRAQKEALDEYKKRLQKEYYEFVTGFVMEKEGAVSISGLEVRDTKRPEAVQKLMDEFFLSRAQDSSRAQPQQ